MEHFTLKITCPDQKGIIATITGMMAKSGVNILELTQHTASDFNIFMFKTLFTIPENFNKAIFEKTLNTIAKQFKIQWELYSMSRKQRVALLVSKTNHCLWELMLKHKDGEIECDIPVIISNHSVNESIAEQFNTPFYKINYTKGKEHAENEMQSLLEKYQIDLLVMARFMQILSAEFSQRWENRIINIHHGFLPAFQGAKPYHQAWYRGVKIIGATAHFANENLDQGPIIAQEVIKVSDRYSIKQLIKMGKNVERQTLVNALSLYLSHSIFVHENRTFILR